MTKEYNKNFIIQQSAKLFYYKGYKNTELTDIFKACDMPNDIFYKFFSSKEELLSSVIKYHTENLINFFNNNVDDLSIDKFHYFFEKYFENIGNLALELSELNNNIREELVKSYKKIELRFSFFITTLKYAFPKKYDDIVPETTARLLIALLEGTILMLKTEKESFAINDFFVFFDSLFKLGEDKKIEEQSNKEIQETSDTEKIYIPDSIKSEIIDFKDHESNIQTDIKSSQDFLNNGIEETNQENTEIEVSEHENSSLDDNMYYELDSDSLINVFDDLENYQKSETEDDE